MTQEEILEGNKLIAEFSKGCNYIPHGKLFFETEAKGKWSAPRTREVNLEMNAFEISPNVSEKLGYLIDIKSLKFHTSWDWLMPVVEKIEAAKAKTVFADYLGFTVKIASNYCSIACHEKNKQDGVIYQNPYGFNPKSKIEAAWLAVVEFIKWYNQNK